MTSSDPREAMIERIAARQPRHFTLGSEAGARAVKEVSVYMPIDVLPRNAGNMIVDAIGEVIESEGIFVPSRDTSRADELWAIRYGAEHTVMNLLRTMGGAKV